MRVTGASHLWDYRGDSSGDLTCDPATGLFTSSADDDDACLDATGCVVTPGLVNAHHHLLQTAFRTLPGTRGVPMREWLAVMGAAYRRTGVDPELAAAAASAGLAEAVLRGVTTVADHHLTWLGPSVEDDVALASSVAATARRLGVRLVFVRGTAGDDPERAALSAEAIVTALTSDAKRSTRPAKDAAGPDMVQVAVGPAGVHSDSKETFALLGEVAARYGLRRRTQANEQVDVAIAMEKYGRRPLDLLDEWGWLAPDVTLAHLCDVTPQEVQRVAKAGVSVTHAPGCDLPMGWGTAPMAALSDAGAAVGLGTSGGGSNDAGHLLADARLAMQVAPLSGRPITAREALTWATAGAATGLGRGPAEFAGPTRTTETPESADATGAAGADRSAGTAGPLRFTGTTSAAGSTEAARAAGAAGLVGAAGSAGMAGGLVVLGSLEVGAAADFVCWDVTGVADAGVADPIAGLLWADPGRRPKHVVVGGRVVVRDYRLVNADERALARDLNALLRARE